MSRASAARCAVQLAITGSILMTMLSSSAPELQNPLNACTYQSIQAAIDAAPPGWRVRVCDGVHDETVTVRKPLTMYGASRNGAVLTGGNAPTIITVEGVASSVIIQQLTLRPLPGPSATRTAVRIASSRAVTLSALSVDFHGITVPPNAVWESNPDGSARPVFNGFVGVDVEGSTVRVKGSSIQSVGPHDYESVGIRVRGISTVRVAQVEVNNSGGTAIQSSDSDVTIDQSIIRRSVTDGVKVLSGYVQIFDSTIDAVAQDGLVVSGGVLQANRVNVTGPLRYGALAAGGLLVLDQARIEHPGEGIHDTLGVVVARNSVIQNARGYGLYAHDSGLIVYDRSSLVGGDVGVFLDYPAAYVALSSSTISGTQGRGIEVNDGQFLMTGGNVANAGQEGVWAGGGQILLDRITVEQSHSDGTVVSGTTDATLAMVNVKYNAGWGVVCDGGTMGQESKVTLNACIGHFEGNTEGPTRLYNGCQILYTCINLAD